MTSYKFTTTQFYTTNFSNLVRSSSIESLSLEETANNVKKEVSKPRYGICPSQGQGEERITWMEEKIKTY